MVSLASGFGKPGLTVLNITVLKEEKKLKTTDEIVRIRLPPRTCRVSLKEIQEALESQSPIWSLGSRYPCADPAARCRE